MTVWPARRRSNDGFEMSASLAGGVSRQRGGRGTIDRRHDLPERKYAAAGRPHRRSMTHCPGGISVDGATPAASTVAMSLSAVASARDARDRRAMRPRHWNVAARSARSRSDGLDAKKCFDRRRLRDARCMAERRVCAAPIASRGFARRCFAYGVSSRRGRSRG